MARQKLLSIAAMATCLIGGASTHTAFAETARINAGLVASLIEGSFRGTVLRLNNYGARRGDSWHVPKDSLLRLSPALGGREIRFNIPEVVIRARVKLPLVPDPKFTARYYVNDLNLSRINAAAEGSVFKIAFHFESRGTELKGRCSAGCVVGSDDTAPDFQINRARVDIFLTPAVYRDGLSYSTARAEFHASVDSSGLGEFFETSIKRQIKGGLEGAISDALNKDDARARVYSALRPTLTGAGIGVMRSVRMEGGNLVIDHMPARR